MKKHKRLFKSITILLLIIFLFLSFYDFIFQINGLNTDRTMNHLKDVGKQTANIYNEKFNNLKNTISNASHLIGENEYSEEYIGDILDNVRTDKINFDRVWYIKPNKKLYNFKTHESIESSEKYIDEIFKGNSGISDVFVSQYNQKEVIAVYSPVYQNGNVIGGISGIIEINNKNSNYIYDDLFNNKAYVFITTDCGQIITKMENENTLYYGKNYFDFLKNDVEYNSGNYEELLENIKVDKFGFLKYSYNGSTRIIYYTPAKINNWYVFTIISENIVTHQNKIVSNITLSLIFKLSVVFFIMLYLIVRYFIKINKINEETNKKLEKSNKKIEMILKQTSDRMFEYNIDQDSLVLDAWNDYPKIMLNHFLKNLHNYNFVSKEHESLLINKFNESINGKEKNMFDAKFPYISKDEDTWFHVSMVKENQMIMGVLRNSTREMNEYNVLIQDQMFKNSVYSHALFMFALNLKSHKVVIYQSEGEYHNIIDVNYEDKFLVHFLELVHHSDYNKVKDFFDYQNIQDIYHNNGKNKIEYRQLNKRSDKYEWVRFRIQFERQSSNNEILMIAYSININDEKSKQLEYEFKSQRDGLTGLYNRQTFNQFVDDYLSHKSHIDYCAYMIIDLDNFKMINDSLGHTQGDIVIQEVAKILDEICYKDGYAGRFGGDEFVAFLYNQESYAEIEEKLRKIVKNIEKIDVGKKYDISASVGVTFVKDEKNHNQLFDKCDQALYVSKNSGKNRYYIHIDDENTGL
ncbi:MAG: diguanylate cyclase [Longibaculum sp.]